MLGLGKFDAGSSDGLGGYTFLGVVEDFEKQRQMKEAKKREGN